MICILFFVYTESKHNRLKGKDGGKPTAQGMVKELSQARQDHLSNFLSSNNPNPHSSAWGAQDTSSNTADDNDSDEDTWSIDSEKQNCCSCFKMPHKKRQNLTSALSADDETEVNLCLVESDELSQQDEEA